MRIAWVVVVEPTPAEFLDSLGKDVVLVERNGPSLLYRVRPQEQAGAGLR